MPDLLKKVPTSGQVVSFTFTDAQAPYVDAWFVRLKREGESLSDFLQRLMTDVALADTKTQVDQTMQATYDTSIAGAATTMGDDCATVESEYSSERTALGVA